jgi:NAD(P)-dependent dehydrogenase (short-subunit alcohol dehydrogenase family)
VFPAASFVDLASETFRRTLAVNLTGTFLACRAATRLMLPGRSGRMVLFSSMQARSPAAHSANYAASKGGVLGLARSLALELAGSGIRVNTISPGLTDTPQPRGHLSEAELVARAQRIPLGRLGHPDDAAEACLFLLGDESGFITGQDLRLNGGATLW